MITCFTAISYSNYTR